MSEITNELYKDFIYKKADTNSNSTVIKPNGKLERTPETDKFESKNSKKYKLLNAGIGALAISAAALTFFCGKKSNQKIVEACNAEIQKITAAHSTEVGKLQEQITALVNKNQDEDRIITEALEGILNSSDKTGALKEKLMEQYGALIEKAELTYDFKQAPAEKIYEKTDWAKVFKAKDIKPLRAINDSTGDFLNISKLKAQFMQDGKLVLAIPSQKEIQAVKTEAAFIDGKTIPNLGEIVDSEITTAYGIRINWSEEKIARDIMQNFYDGHGNTLDGIQVALEKLPNGKTKVKISGKGFYEYTNLQLLGSGNKCENPYNAGGFGEGTKVLVANLLGKGDTSRVTYSCADWKLSFCAPKKGNNVIRRKLEKVPEIFEGNSIEFETENQKLVDSILESINYFNHSQNPDFQKLTYDSKDFAFRFLGENKGGNIYLTQRFEFEGDGKWEGSVDGLNLIFKRKPDPEKYKKLTGMDLPKDRDRTGLSYEDIENLTHYFAHDMSDEDLIASILSTKPMWGKIDINPSQSALKSFLKGLIEEASQRTSVSYKYSTGLKLDMGEEKFVAFDNVNETVYKYLSGYGYKFLPNFFANIGIDSASKVFRKMSVHKSLEPTVVEIKKLKLLEEGLKIVQDNIQKSLSAHLKKADIVLHPAKKEKMTNGTCLSLSNMINSEIEQNEKIKAIISKYKKSGYISFYEIKKLSDEDMEELLKELSASTTQKLRAMADNPNSKEINEIISDIRNIASNNEEMVDEKILDYFRTLKDYSLIEPEDVTKPRYIFDRHSEIAKNTLGESIVDGGEYKGHWVDREYLNTADFMQILGTWIHEVCHKSGGDGTSTFTYALTDMLRVLLRSGATAQNCAKLSALEELFNKL